MAVDTAAKRNSAMVVGLPLRIPPLPDGTIAQGDRQHLAMWYAGITSTPVVSYPYYIGVFDVSLTRSLSVDVGFVQSLSYDVHIN